MSWKEEWKKLAGILGVFLLFYFIPLETDRVRTAVLESLFLAQDYAREHVILCLIPAFFIAGAIGVFISKGSVMKYLGAQANKAVAYGVASVSGGILAVCSCTVLPLFSGIYKMGAGLGPATTFLYAGPAINVLAIILTARVLGLEMGIARAVGAIVFSIIIGLIMSFVFRREEKEKADAQMALPEETSPRSLVQNALFFASLVGILVFANWGSAGQSEGVWAFIYQSKWILTAFFTLAMGIMLVRWFEFALWKIGAIAVPVGILAVLFPHMPLFAFSAGIVGLSWFTSTDTGETQEWFSQSWDFAKQIFPLLFAGVLVAGLLLGRPGSEGLIPAAWIEAAVGGNSFGATLFASVAGALMYFATLTEVPILEGLINSGMGKGPALALLLAGPALSLPNMLVIKSVLGTKKTLIFIFLVVIMATVSGVLYGHYF
ncbi:MAG: permease [Fibrobacterota bacterium]